MYSLRKARHLVKRLSRLVFPLSCFGAGLALLVGFFWLSITPVFGGALLLLTISSGFVYLRQRQRRDLCSLILSGVSCLSVVGEAVTLFFVPLHGPW